LPDEFDYLRRGDWLGKSTRKNQDTSFLDELPSGRCRFHPKAVPFHGEPEFVPWHQIELFPQRLRQNDPPRFINSNRFIRHDIHNTICQNEMDEQSYPNKARFGLRISGPHPVVLECGVTNHHPPQ